MIHHSKRDQTGHLDYPAEHSSEDQLAKTSLLPQSNQFADTGRTLGVRNRGWQFTGRGIDGGLPQNARLHSAKSLLYDDRQDSESFIDSRNGAQANPAFKDAPTPQTTGPVPGGVEFVPSTAEPADQGQGGAGPSWWERIKNSGATKTTQSTNAATKPPEKFQLPLPAGQPKPVKKDQGVTLVNAASGGVIGSISR